MFSMKSELFKLKDTEEREAALMPSRPEVSPRALEKHGQERCRSRCPSVKLLAETPRKPGRSFHACVMWVTKHLCKLPTKKIHQKLSSVTEKYRLTAGPAFRQYLLGVLDTSKLLPYELRNQNPREQRNPQWWQSCEF